MNNIAISKLIKIVLSILLLLCLLRMPYAYYEFVRFVAMIGFAILAYISYLENNDQYDKNNKRFGLVILYAVLTLLFQPFFKIYLGRTLWNIIDLLVAIVLIFSLFYNKKAKDV